MDTDEKKETLKGNEGGRGDGEGEPAGAPPAQHAAPPDRPSESSTDASHPQASSQADSQPTSLKPLTPKERVQRSLGDRGGPLTEYEATNIARLFGIPVPPGVLNLVDGMPFEGPYVVKVCSDKILHKTEVGGVRLNVHAQDLPAVVSEMKEKFAGENILVEKMAPKGFEVIVGLIRDSTFGLSIMFGLGGIFTEVFRDVSFRVLPITMKDAEEMVDELRSAEVLKGFRGIKLDLEAVYKLLLKVSEMAMALEDRIDQLDLNPVLVYEKGLTVVDVKMILRKKSSTEINTEMHTTPDV